MDGWWRDAPDEVEPTVLILGGFLTSPPLYIPMRRRLLERGAAEVVVAPVWLPDWLIAAQRGMGPILTRSGKALLRASELAAGSERSGGAPLLVVGHSAGGLTARLLTSPEPFAGRRLGAAQRIGAIVTLGTPHNVKPDGHLRPATRRRGHGLRGPCGARAGVRAHDGLPRSRLAGRRRACPATRRARLAYGLYRSFDAELVPTARRRPANPEGGVQGDGLVPVRSAGLAGVETIVLDGIAHGQARRGPWYGSDEALDVWWPRAVEVWRAALRARMEASVL